MKVYTRSGATEVVSFDKITARLEALRDAVLGKGRSAPLSRDVDVSKIAAQACASMFDGISTVRLDELTADIACALCTEHPDYGTLAARILVSNLHKSTTASVVDTFGAVKRGLSNTFLEDIHALGDEFFMSFVDYSRDYYFDYFGFRTLEKMYLTKDASGTAVIERPQHMYIRVAVALWGRDVHNVKKTYEELSRHRFTHASPTLFNAGATNQQLASCFLHTISDSLDAIFSSFGDIAKISKNGGGLGVSVHDIRSRGAPIKTTSSGKSDGLVPMLRVANDVIRYVNQSGRRKGSMAIYIEPSHPDIFEVLDLKRNAGDEHLRARDLFYAMWVPDLFMRRVMDGGMWSLFDPDACPGLSEVWGAAYDALYDTYESKGMASRTVPAQDVWHAMVRSQIETGQPYVLFKDACNAKSNQQNLGCIKSSNLCTEIVEYTSSEETAVCNLGSLSLPAFVKRDPETGEPIGYDFSALVTSTCILAKNLDRVIDVTVYPIASAKTSNMRHRPIGIGVQGLHDVFFQLRFPFDSPEARKLNIEIFEAIYYAAIRTSCDLAIDTKEPYSSFEGSPASMGKLQFDLWDTTPSPLTDHRFEWEELKADVVQCGLRNSLSVAPMPTASTAQILGNTECFEPVTSNLYSRRTLAGEFVVVNTYLVSDLMRLGMWTKDIKDRIITYDGSVQNVHGVPDDIKALYRTAWEIPQKSLVDMAADRGAFVCQSQSLNLFMAVPTYKKVTAALFHGWRRGLKTGMYYLRTKPASRAVQVTVAPEGSGVNVAADDDGSGACLMCSS
jgi:ribonucleoside-diphosphate reductase alpha subunit